MLFNNTSTKPAQQVNDTKYYDDIDSANRAYDDYIDTHVNNVIRSWREILRLNLEYRGVSRDILYKADYCINHHDESKLYGHYDEDSDDCFNEYTPYRQHFYPLKNESRIISKEELEYQYDLAWNHHQKVNPHHWQYWILIRDEGKQVPLEMKEEYIYEMLCDWHSFSAKDPESTAYNWYHKNRDKMVLAPKTREIVESLVECFKNRPLSQI